MNKETPYRDQADRLRQTMERQHFEEGEMVENKLASRTRVHKHKHKKTKIKMKYPLIRLLVMFFILLPIIIFIVYSALGNKVQLMALNTAEDSEGFETVDIKQEQTSTTTDENKTSEDSQVTEEVTAADSEEQEQISVTIEEEETEQTETSENSQVAEEATAPVQNDDTSTNPVEPQIVYHTVTAGETIYSISTKYYKSKEGIDTIKKANNLSSNQISVGQVLTIPLNE